MRRNLRIAFGVLLVATAASGVNADEDLSIVINPFTGATSIRNDSIVGVTLDSYFINASGAPVLDPVGWNSLEDQSVGDFQESGTPQANRLAELDFFGPGLFIPALGSASIGNAYTPFVPSAFGEEVPGLDSLLATYGLVGETFDRTADVEFSAQNSVVLVVDEKTGSTTLENLSGFDIDIDSYLIESAVANVLDPSGWTPLSASDSEWTSGTGQTNRLFEGNFGDSTELLSGNSLAIGSAIDASLINDEEDLRFEFSINGVSEDFVGGVIIVPDDTSADFDVDSDVDLFDLLTLQRGFGVGTTFAEGDANLDGSVDADDQAVVLGQLGAGGSAAVAGVTAAVSVVPEPSTLILFAVSCGPLALSRRRRGVA